MIMMTMMVMMMVMMTLMLKVYQSDLSFISFFAHFTCDQRPFRIFTCACLSVHNFNSLRKRNCLHHQLLGCAWHALGNKRIVSSFVFQKVREAIITLYVTDTEDIFQLSQLSAISSFKGTSGLLCYFN